MQHLNSSRHSSWVRGVGQTVNSSPLHVARSSLQVCTQHSYSVQPVSSFALPEAVERPPVEPPPVMAARDAAPPSDARSPAPPFGRAAGSGAVRPSPRCLRSRTRPGGNQSGRARARSSALPPPRLRLKESERRATTRRGEKRAARKSRIADARASAGGRFALRRAPPRGVAVGVVARGVPCASASPAHADSARTSASASASATRGRSLLALSSSFVLRRRAGRRRARRRGRRRARRSRRGRRGSFSRGLRTGTVTRASAAGERALRARASAGFCSVRRPARLFGVRGRARGRRGGRGGVRAGRGERGGARGDTRRTAGASTSGDVGVRAEVAAAEAADSLRYSTVVVILGFSAAFSQARRGARYATVIGHVRGKQGTRLGILSGAAAAARPRNRRRSRGDEKRSARVLSSEENSEQNESETAAKESRTKKQSSGRVVRRRRRAADLTMARTRSASSASASEVTMTYRPAAAREASDQSSARVTAASASTRSRRDRSSATTTTTTTDGADDRGGIVAGGPRVARERDARIIGTPPVLGALVLFIVVLVVVALLCVASPSARARRCVLSQTGPHTTASAW